MVIKVFFENKDLENIDENVNYDELEQYAKERALPYYRDDTATIWNIYAQKYAEERGMTHSCRLSFGYIVSSIFGGMGVSCSTAYYFKEEEILDECISTLNELRESELSEKEVMKELFNFIFIRYDEKIESYCYKTEKLNLKISLPMMERFNQIEGGSNAEKFRNLMK